MTRIHHRKRGHDAVTHIALWPRGRPVSNSDGLHQEAAVSGFDYSLAGTPSTSLLLLSATTWMPTSVGMTMRGIDQESELLAIGSASGDRQGVGGESPLR